MLVLNLAGNRIADEGAKSFAEVTTLTLLLINRKSFDDLTFAMHAL